jgi:hypothetical protein
VALLNEADREQLRRQLLELASPVKLVFFMKRSTAITVRSRCKFSKS